MTLPAAESAWLGSDFLRNVVLTMHDLSITVRQTIQADPPGPAAAEIEQPFLAATRRHIVQILPRFATFLSGQLGVQTLTFVAGFLSLRWLTVEDYAQFGLAFAFQSLAGVMVDCGFSNTLVALVGDRRDDPSTIGSYLRSAWRYRNRLFAIAVPTAGLFFFSIGMKHQWPIWTQLWVFLGIVTTIWLQGGMMLQSVLLMHGRLRDYYTAQLGAAFVRIALIAALHAAGWLNAVTAVWIATAAYAVTTLVLRMRSHSLYVLPRRSSSLHDAECRRLALPQLPPILFYAFQGQLTVGLISILGSTRNIAEVSALGRLGQLFVLFGMFNGVFVEPMMARSPAASVPRRYEGVLTGSVVVAATVTLLAYTFPDPLLWILGPKYADMRNQVALLVAASAIGYVGHAAWVMNLARKFVTWWSTSLQVVAVIGLQCAAIPFLPLSTTAGVLKLSVVAALATLIAHLFGGAWGISRLRRANRQAELGKLGTATATPMELLTS